MTTIKERKTKLERLHEARETASGRIETIEARLDEITDALAELRVQVEGDLDGDAAGELRQERGELEDERREMRAILPVVERRIADARDDLDQAAAEETIQRLRQTAGGLTGEYPRHVERAEEYEEKAQNSREKARAAVSRSWRARWAAQAVAALLDVEAGEISTVAGVRPPRAPIRTFISQRKLRRAGREAIKFLDGEGLLSDEAATAIERAIVALDDDEEARRREEQRRAKLDVTAREREQARETVDDFLRDLLQRGPVPRERIADAARHNGIPLTPGGDGAHGANLLDARQRLGILAIERIEDRQRPRPSWWALPGRWDGDEFRMIRDASRSSSMAGMR